MSRFLVRQTAPVTYIDRRQLLRSLQSEDVFRVSQQALHDKSCTLYVGNLSYFTREAQIWSHFSPYGSIREIMMGLREQEELLFLSSSPSSSFHAGTLSRKSDARGSRGGGRGNPVPVSSSSPSTGSFSSILSPCGFCFVVYEHRAAAVAAWLGLHLSLLDDRLISVSWDVGLDAPFRASSLPPSPPPPGGGGVSALSLSFAAVPGEVHAGSDSDTNHHRSRIASVTCIHRTPSALAEDALSRRFGRGINGGQVVDNIRQTLDDGRGGLGGLRKAAALLHGEGDGAGGGRVSSLVPEEDEDEDSEGGGGRRRKCRSDAEAMRMLLTRARMEEQQEQGSSSSAHNSNPNHHNTGATTSMKLSFWNISALRCRWNQWNGMEGEGEDVCYYWIKGSGAGQRRRQRSRADFSSSFSSSISREPLHKRRRE